MPESNCGVAMKTEDEVKLMIARIEGRIEAIGGGDAYSDMQKLETLKWVMGEVDRL
jgi:hypothetical protein